MQPEKLMIVVAVPPEHADAVLEAIASAGGGIVGDYSHCAFTQPGTGRFKPSDDAHPYVGARSTINTVQETRIETFCQRDQAKAILAAIRRAHPYEEPVIYLIPLLSESDL